MLRTAFAAAAALLAATSLAAQAPPQPAAVTLPTLDAELGAQLTCSAAFAIVASEQARGTPLAGAWPQLSIRGREFFVRFGARTMDATGASREAVRALLEGEVARLQKVARDSGNPDAALAPHREACVERLDREVAKLAKPTLAQCTAIMSLAYEEVYARDRLESPRSRDLKTLATVLESRERKALQAQGLSNEAVDRRVSEAHDAMLKEALVDGPGVEKYDLQTCYDLAAPEEDKHY
jgi:hypothetical protein